MALGNLLVAIPTGDRETDDYVRQLIRENLQLCSYETCVIESPAHPPTDHDIIDNLSVLVKVGLANIVIPESFDLRRLGRFLNLNEWIHCWIVVVRGEGLWLSYRQVTGRQFVEASAQDKKE